MTTDPTPRDVHGQPLEVGRWYWVRDVDSPNVMQQVKIRSIDKRCVWTDREVGFATWCYEFLPADGPPAWPEPTEAKP